MSDSEQSEMDKLLAILEAARNEEKVLQSLVADHLQSRPEALDGEPLAELLQRNADSYLELFQPQGLAFLLALAVDQVAIKLVGAKNRAAGS